MRLPNAEEAIVDERKLREYCLSREHPRGRHKTRVFEAVLGLTEEDSREFALALKRAATENDSLPGISDFYGDRYIIDFIWTRAGREATVRSIWIVLREECFPRFVTGASSRSEVRMTNLELLSEVALLKDLPESGLVRGQVGTVVERLAADAVEVEFCDNEGRTYATAALKLDDLVPLHRAPLEQVA